MRVSLRVFIAVAIAILSICTGSVEGSGADKIKVIVHKRSVRVGNASTTQTIAPTVFAMIGAEVLDEQTGFIVVEIQKASLPALTEGALKAGALSIEPREDFDKLDFLEFPIDARQPIPAYPAAYARTAALPAGARDAFVLQFKSIPRPEWLEAIRSAGVTIIDYIPQNGYTVLGSQDVLADLATRLPIQLLRLHQPVHKIAASLRTQPPDFVDVVVVVHKGVEGELTRDYLKSVTLSEPRPPDEVADRSYLRLTLASAALSQVAALPGTIWIEPMLSGIPSGEREVNISAGIVNEIYPRTLVPWTQGVYPGWLASWGINPELLSPTALLDSGWHNGAGSVHNDLRTNAGSNTVSTVNYCVSDHEPDVDCYGHGTMLAGLIGGNASGPYGSQTRDSGGSGYWMGLGIAPGAPVISGRIYSFTGHYPALWQPLDWTSIYADLSARLGVRVTNNSWNEGSTDLSALSYSTNSQILDRIVRHAGWSDAYPAMTIVFSAGNMESPPTGWSPVTAPANAKNVISVGATQNYNPNTYEDLRAGTPGGPTAGPAASNGYLMWSGSRIGPTYIEGRIKPDLVAPGTGIESPRTEYNGDCLYTPVPQVGSTIDPAESVNSRHVWSRGTSFSAPLVSGASSLLRATRGAISPAMTKAMLLGLTSPLATNDFRPTNESGWGRLNLSRAFKTAYPTGYYMVDESVVMTPGSAYFATNDLTPLDPNRPVKIVLAWTDGPGAPGTGRQLRNDLDLVVYSRQFFGLFSAGNNFDAPGIGTMGWSTTFGLGRFPTYDRLNNVEVVVVPADLGSTFWVEVRNPSIVTNALSVMNGNPAQQDFALFIDNVR